MDYGKLFRIIRASKNLSQKEFGDIIGLNYSYVSKIESNKRIPSKRAEKKVLKKFNIPRSLYMLLTTNQIPKREGKTVQKLGSTLLNIILEQKK